MFLFCLFSRGFGVQVRGIIFTRIAFCDARFQPKHRPSFSPSP
jgi:hypothetical protein